MRVEEDEDGRVWFVVERLDEIPQSFPSEHAEAVWWDTHDFSDDVRAQMLAQTLAAPPPSLFKMLPQLRQQLPEQAARTLRLLDELAADPEVRRQLRESLEAFNRGEPAMPFREIVTKRPEQGP